MKQKIGTGRSDLRERAAQIAQLANNLSDELASLDVREPSFEYGLPEPLRSDAPESKAGTMKQKLVEEVDELNALLTEPALMLTSEMVNEIVSELTCYRVNKWTFAEKSYAQHPFNCPSGYC